MTRSLLAGFCALLFASMSTAAFAACAGHSVSASVPVQTADISTPGQSQDSADD